MKENRRVAMTKTLLRDSLLELMHQKPLTKITIKEICENADINRSTFYSHYSDQFALCEDIENDTILRTNEYLEKISKDKTKVDFLTDYLRYIKKNGRLLRALLISGNDNSFKFKFLEISVSKLMEADHHDNLSETDKDYIFRYMFQGALSAVERWIENEFDKSPAEMSRLIIALIPSLTEVKRKMIRLEG